LASGCSSAILVAEGWYQGQGLIPPETALGNSRGSDFPATPSSPLPPITLLLENGTLLISHVWPQRFSGIWGCQHSLSCSDRPNLIKPSAWPGTSPDHLPVCAWLCSLGAAMGPFPVQSECPQGSAHGHSPVAMMVCVLVPSGFCAYHAACWWQGFVRSPPSDYTVSPCR
jgi:hypothetical protein